MLARDIIEPTPERYQHDRIERADHTIADDAGRPSQPFRACDTLAAMLRNGSISPEMYQIASDFRSHFRRAQLDPLKSADLTRTRVDCPNLPLHRGNLSSLAALRDMLDRLGPLPASCLWHVVGFEQSLKQWAREHRRHEKVAAGILISALDTLARHYSPPRS